ncbi:PREDICTED: translation initiation factor IF-2-like [Chinchilla lanigera]|uniref:translation initiation factor IF-2-like n=1 Tax=Chinchilla lanigera TaxID=34839 RepID=UPI00038EEDBE|nr:PREDICTED: translation initiation factor IF-2-like [Chinchilla lanigera]XP_005385737.1 PREDICTED: translation initiation factor IF-2-like [Chinchilla lanigera]XP_005385738.1 PREDICTED: translation initiation factor IF-2-like [Chinchilla lanigera]XP_005385739.1 PREDICTED: translation initiation factor IF-2-like [Chinchilla lanigera]
MLFVFLSAPPWERILGASGKGSPPPPCHQPPASGWAPTHSLPLGALRGPGNPSVLEALLPHDPSSTRRQRATRCGVALGRGEGPGNTPGQAGRPTTQFHSAPPGFQTTTLELCTIESRFDRLRPGRGSAGAVRRGKVCWAVKVLPSPSRNRRRRPLPRAAAPGAGPPPSRPVRLAKSRVPSASQALWVTVLEPTWDSGVGTPMWQSPRDLESIAKHRRRCRGKGLLGREASPQTLRADPTPSGLQRGHQQPFLSGGGGEDTAGSRRLWQRLGRWGAAGTCAPPPPPPPCAQADAARRAARGSCVAAGARAGPSGFSPGARSAARPKPGSSCPTRPALGGAASCTERGRKARAALDARGGRGGAGL